MQSSRFIAVVGFLVIVCGSVGLVRPDKERIISGENDDDPDTMRETNVLSSAVQIVGNIVRVPAQLQEQVLNIARQKCDVTIQAAAANRQLHYEVATVSDVTLTLTCPSVWDGLACWSETTAGQLAVQPCPPYIHNFRVNVTATRQCGSDGAWYYSLVFNKTWSNYSECAPSRPVSREAVTLSTFVKTHVGYIRMISNIGYSLSLVAMLLAIVTMLTFKKLRHGCPRNTLHVNLFLSFIARASLALVRDWLMGGSWNPAGGGDNEMINYDDDNVPHWECRLLITLFNYAIVSNYSWIFVEALYLHTLLFIAVFSESSGITYYIIFGWVAPLMCICPWVVLRLTTENVRCWDTHPTQWIFWIIKGPVLATIVFNFFFFLNIVRILFTKLQAFNAPESRRYKYRKLAKSALVLIPLFGVPYIVFLGVQHRDVDEVTDIAKLYFEMTFNSFNMLLGPRFIKQIVRVLGFFVALLYCFLNGEVQAEISKKWQRYMLVNWMDGKWSGLRGSGVTSNTYATRIGRHSSRTMNSSVLDRDDPYNQANSSGCYLDDGPTAQSPVKAGNKDEEQSPEVHKALLDDNHYGSVNRGWASEIQKDNGFPLARKPDVLYLESISTTA